MDMSTGRARAALVAPFVAIENDTAWPSVPLGLWAGHSSALTVGEDGGGVAIELIGAAGSGPKLMGKEDGLALIGITSLPACDGVIALVAEDPRWSWACLYMLWI